MTSSAAVARISRGGFLVRSVRESDTAAIHRHISAIYADYGDVLDVEREDTHLREPGSFFRSDGGEFWVVLDGDELIATGAIFLMQDLAEIRTIYVRTDRRRLGLARALTQMGIDHAVHRGYRVIHLWSDKRYTEAHRLYESMGFVRIGEREVRITNAYSEWRYRLTLN
ncbi:MAG: GNAT family N-acetyltransferase [Phycisphaerales bacterium]|nr:GNAT family N-acetyltransferase [Phycisphaerales bacterium]